MKFLKNFLLFIIIVQAINASNNNFQDHEKEKIEQLYAKAKLQEEKEFTDTQIPIKWATQEEFVCASSEDSAPILATLGIKTCMGIVIYNPDTKKGALGHFSEGTNINESLDILIETLKPISSPLQIHLRGGYIDYSNEEREFILNILKAIIAKNLELYSVKFFETYKYRSNNILENEFNVSRLAFDTRTGQLYTSFVLNEESSIYSRLLKDGDNFFKKIIKKSVAFKDEIPLENIILSNHRIGSL